jgi:hypothetical protein
MPRLGVRQRCLLGLLIALLPMTPLGARWSSAGLPETQDPQDALHEVEPGDNLHLIAGYYYGDARQWERIWRENREQVPNPNLLERGTLLRIPDVTIPSEPYIDFVARARRLPGRVDASEGLNESRRLNP